MSQPTRGELPENRLSEVILDAAIEVHRELGGPGLLESVYEEALVFELQQRNLEVARQVGVPLVYKGNALSSELRLDLLVNGLVVVECKAVKDFNPVFISQVLTYLRLLDLRLGLVVNFGQPRIVDGWHRVVNGL